MRRLSGDEVADCDVAVKVDMMGFLSHQQMCWTDPCKGGSMVYTLTLALCGSSGADGRSARHAATLMGRLM
jgi:hypothetical protein